MVELLTGSQVRIMRQALGWSRNFVAAQLCCDEATIRALEALAVVDPKEWVWLVAVYAVFKAVPRSPHQRRPKGRAKAGDEQPANHS